MYILFLIWIIGSTYGIQNHVPTKVWMKWQYNILICRLRWKKNESKEKLKEKQFNWCNDMTHLPWENQQNLFNKIQQNSWIYRHFWLLLGTKLWCLDYFSHSLMKFFWSTLFFLFKKSNNNREKKIYLGQIECRSKW